MANEEYTQSTLRGDWEKQPVWDSSQPRRQGKIRTGLGAPSQAKRGRVRVSMETGEGGEIPIPMETEEGWGPYGDRTGVSTGKCFRREPKSRAPRKVPGPGCV